jgi:hypothetical protein
MMDKWWEERQEARTIDVEFLLNPTTSIAQFFFET